MQAKRAERAEAALRESGERFCIMTDREPMMMCVSDTKGRCTNLNQRWYEFTSQSEAKVQGFGWLIMLHPDDWPPSGREIRNMNPRPESSCSDYRQRHVNWAYRWVIDAASRRFSHDGEFFDHVGSMIDKDKRKGAGGAPRESEARCHTLYEAI
jgi:PAS domain S-box-containing protein